MKKQLLFLLFSLFTVVSYAFSVKGTVTDAAFGDPMYGVTVKEKGGAASVMTDVDGNYVIEVKDANAVLSFTSVGMAPKDEPVKGRSVVDVVMEEESEVLDAVVVTAMGQTQEKKKLNFAVQALNSDEVTAGQSANFVNGLQGKIAGVQVSMAGG